jgi:hypothetical protein
MSDRLQARYNELRKRLFGEISNLGISPLLLCELDAEAAANVVKQLLLTMIQQEHPDSNRQEAQSPELYRLNVLLQKTRDWPAFVAYISRLKKDVEKMLEGQIELLRQVAQKHKESKEATSKLADILRHNEFL